MKNHGALYQQAATLCNSLYELATEAFRRGDPKAHRRYSRAAASAYNRTKRRSRLLFGHYDTALTMDAPL